MFKSKAFWNGFNYTLACTGGYILLAPLWDKDWKLKLKKTYNII